MWAAATLQRTSTPPGISTRPTIRSFSPFSLERTGSGVTSIRLCSSLLDRFLAFHFLVEPKGKMTMTQGKHLAVPVSERDHSQGPATAAVTLVQYGDYDCP